MSIFFLALFRFHETINRKEIVLALTVNFEDVLKEWDHPLDNAHLLPRRRGRAYASFDMKSKDELFDLSNQEQVSLQGVRELLEKDGEGFFGQTTPETECVLRQNADQAPQLLRGFKDLSHNISSFLTMVDAAEGIAVRKNLQNIWPNEIDLYLLTLEWRGVVCVPMISVEKKGALVNSGTLYVKYSPEVIRNLIIFGRAHRTEYDDFLEFDSYSWGEISEKLSRVPEELPVVFPNVANKRMRILHPVFSSGIRGEGKSLSLKWGNTLSTVGDFKNAASLHRSNMKALVQTGLMDFRNPQTTESPISNVRGLSIYPDRLEVVLHDSVRRQERRRDEYS